MGTAVGRQGKAMGELKVLRHIEFQICLIYIDIINQITWSGGKTDLRREKDNSHSRNLSACPTMIPKLLVEQFGTGTETGSNLLSDTIFFLA